MNMEWLKFLPWIMVFGFPATAYWLTKNVLIDYAKKTDVRELCQKLSNRINLVEAEFKAHKDQSDKENKVLFKKIDDMTDQMSQMNKSLIELVTEFRHIESELRSKN